MDLGNGVRDIMEISCIGGRWRGVGILLRGRCRICLLPKCVSGGGRLRVRGVVGDCGEGCGYEVVSYDLW